MSISGITDSSALISVISPVSGNVTSTIAGSSGSQDDNSGIKASSLNAALLQSLQQSTTDSSLTSTSNSFAPVAALTDFAQSLLEALNSALSTNSTGLTREQLATSLTEPARTGSNRNERNQALLDNFDSADLNSDGIISKDEAHSFNEANHLATIENGITQPPSEGETRQSYGPTFSENLASGIHGLIQMLSAPSSAPSTPDTTSTINEAAITRLASSFTGMVSALGGNTESTSLLDFLKTLEGNLTGITPSGIVVDTKA